MLARQCVHGLVFMLSNYSDINKVYEDPKITPMRIAIRTHTRVRARQVEQSSRLLTNVKVGKAITKGKITVTMDKLKCV